MKHNIIAMKAEAVEVLKKDLIVIGGTVGKAAGEKAGAEAGAKINIPKILAEAVAAAVDAAEKAARLAQASEQVKAKVFHIYLGSVVSIFGEYWLIYYNLL